MDYVTIPNVELVSVGMEWPASQPLTFTFEHLADALEAANEDPHIVPPRLKIGHEDPRFNSKEVLENSFDPFWDGEPAFGSVSNLRLVNDGATLIGDYVEVPAWLAEALPSAYPNRSIEGGWTSEGKDRMGLPIGSWNVTTPGGKRYSFVLTACALLGLSRPAVQDLEDLRHFLVEGKGLVVAGSAPDGGRPAAGTIGAVAASAKPAIAEADIDQVLDTFCSEFCEDERYWWWPRSVRIDPNVIIADDDEGSLWRVAVQTDGKQNVSFGEPERVLQTFVDAPARAAVTSAAVASLGGEEVASFANRKSSPAFAVTDAAWDGSASRFDDAQWKRSCILDMGDCGDASEMTAKQRYKVPVREPDGTVNRNGCHAAAARLNQVSSCAAAKEKAAKRLVSLYRNELGEDPPESLTNMAASAAQKGGGAAAATTSGMDRDTFIRQQLDLPEDASEEQVDEALAQHEETGEPTSAEESTEPGGEENTEPSSEDTPPAASEETTITVDSEVLKKLQAEAAEGAAARQEQRAHRREAILSQALREGKIMPSSKEAWESKLKAAPEATEAELEKLPKNLVPVNAEGGTSPDAASAAMASEEEMARLFGSAYTGVGS